MPKGQPNKRYTPEFKIKVVETMHREKLSYRETARQFDISNSRVTAWEWIYLEEGADGLYAERRGRKSTGRPPKIKKEKDLIAEVQRLRAENAYLKKLNALVAERVRQEKKHKWYGNWGTNSKYGCSLILPISLAAHITITANNLILQSRINMLT